MRTQLEKAKAFRALHERAGAFIIPNPWDAGTARLLAAMGFEALATTSLGVANTLGTATVSLASILDNCRAITDATDLPSMPIWKIAARTSRRRRRTQSGLPRRQAASRLDRGYDRRPQKSDL